MRSFIYKFRNISAFKHLLLCLLITFVAISMNDATAQVIKFGSGNTGVTANVLESRTDKITIEYLFGGYEQEVVKINGTEYLSLSAPGMISTMEKGLPQIPIYKASVIIPDLTAMNYRIISQESEEVYSKPLIPSKGHMTRDIDINQVPYEFSNNYLSGTWYPESIINLNDPYIIRDFRGMTVQFNPIQYNSNENKLKIYKRIVVEFYQDLSLTVVNPFNRQFPLTRVSSEFADIYRGLFLNYGIGGTRYDSIPEPGRMLVIYPASYASVITPFVQWKTSRGLTVLTAEYPTATGSGAAAIKTYIQNLYNTVEKVTYIILVGDVADIPTLNGVSESAPSDPCYVKLAGVDAYPDAFISRISCQTAASVSYVEQKFIKFERDIEVGAAWYNKATGIGGPDVGGSPAYADSTRMDWIRDTLLAHGFTQVDRVNGPWASATTLINSLNDGKYILNYIGHGSGTSWSNTGFSVTNAYQLANGWKNPFLVDVACLNGNLTLNECLAEALLRAGDTANPKGCITIYASSTNASWVPPCDMQTHAMYLFAHQYRKTAGAISFFGVMKAMDLWGGSSGEGLKLMEQYNIFGDCSLLLTRGVPLGPSITHTPLQNTENLAGPYIVNCAILPANSGIDPSKTKLFWTRGATFTDSLLMTKLSGNNWTANIPGNNSPATYKYYIKTSDSANRISTSPSGAPAYYHTFQATPDVIPPAITHTPIGNTPKSTWPVNVTANVTDNIGIDSVWVVWYKNNTSTTKRFKLNLTTGSTYSAAFNSINSDVNINDSIFYKIYAQDAGSNHKKDSTSLIKFKIIQLTNIIIGNGTTSVGYPYYTFYMDSKCDMLYLGSEITAAGGTAGAITQIGFNVITVGSPIMQGFNIRLQSTSQTTLTGFLTSGWTTVYTNAAGYTPAGTGWQNITLTTPFNWDGTSNIALEICFNNSSWSSNTTVNATSATGMTVHQYQDITAGDGCVQLTAGTVQTSRPNTCFVIGLTGIGNPTIEIPSVYSLSQNYPNPFNPVTQIKYDMPKQGFVSLKVYDILGREVTKLVNEMKAPGSYLVDFDGTNFSSGVYFYKLETNGFTDVKRMLLIK
jgi:hypothetical protein